MNDAENDNRSLEDEAIEWLVRLRGPDAVALKGQFERWQALSPQHRQAYEWAKRHFEDSAILKQSLRRDTGAMRFSPIAWLGGSFAAAAAIALIVESRTPAVVDIAKPVAAATIASPLITRHGEIRSFHLPDGTSVTLDTDSRVAFVIDGGARRIELEQGKARMIVARADHPLIVTAGAGAVTSQAAIFDVSFDEQKVVVRLVNGSADVQPVARPAVYMTPVPVRHVRAGKALCYRASDFAETSFPFHLRNVDDDHWTSGWVEYRAVPLSLLVKQANRYAAKQIVLDGTAVGSLEASGRFRLTDTDAFVARIAEVFDLAASQHSDGTHLSIK